MNLVQRMVAENRETITSTELAEAAKIPHQKICEWIKENRSHFEENGTLLFQDTKYKFNPQQSVLAILMCPPDTNESWELADSMLTVIFARRKAVREIEEMTEETLNNG